MDSEKFEKWLDEREKLPKYRYKGNEGVSSTFDGRSSSKNRDIIKPHNIMNEMKKSPIGTELLNEYKHCGIELTDEVKGDIIIRHINDKYDYLEWE